MVEGTGDQMPSFCLSHNERQVMSINGDSAVSAPTLSVGPKYCKTPILYTQCLKLL